MNQPVATRSWSRYLALAAIAACLLLMVAVVAGPFLLFGYYFQQAMHEFPRRYVEARETIEFVHSYHSQHARWPTPAEVQAQHFGALALGWEYEAAWSAGDPPVLVLHGPYHMRLIYFFVPIQQGTIIDEWIFSIEGDKRYFRAESPYSLK